MAGDIVSPHQGPGHGSITLSLSGETAGGDWWHQSWTVCACGLRMLRAALGPPEHESTADAVAVRRVAQLVLDDPGHVHLLGSEVPDIS